MSPTWTQENGGKPTSSLFTCGPTILEAEQREIIFYSLDSNIAGVPARQNQTLIRRRPDFFKIKEILLNYISTDRKTIFQNIIIPECYFFFTIKVSQVFFNLGDIVKIHRPQAWSLNAPSYIDTVSSHCIPMLMPLLIQCRAIMCIKSCLTAFSFGKSMNVILFCVCR